VFNIGGGELLIIILVIVIFIGPSKLPEVANTLGRLSATIRRFNQSFQDEIRNSFEDPIEEAARQRGNELILKESKESDDTLSIDSLSNPVDRESDVDEER
tara:strand:+ start:4271 stop:4573 length:303 start_codon:yes stop_codon:yes gene_type:complete